MQKTTVIVNTKTRDLLKQIGTKGQTYDQIIAELLALKAKQLQQDGQNSYEQSAIRY